MKKAVGLLTGLAVSFGVATAAHAGPRLDQIMDEQVIRVGTPGDYRPFAIKNDDGEYEGHDIDVIEAMADGLNLSIEYVPTSWPDLLDDLQADKFDVAVGGITRTAARLGQVDMLPGYAPFGKVALARKSEADKYKSLEDLNQPSVHVIKNQGGTNEQFVFDNLTEAEGSKIWQADKCDVAVGGITRTAARLGQVDMLPGYAPFGKVALARKSEADKYKSLEDLNQPSVHVIKNPGGTNEQFVLDNLTEAEVSTHEHNAEIPGLIAEGKGDIMITETFEALHYANEDDRLAALFVDDPLTPQDELGFLLPTDDADFTRVMRFAWDLMDTRGVLDEAQNNWLK